jgi:thiamine biosynthesis lipoprotein
MLVENITRQPASTADPMVRRPHAIWRGASAVPPREFLPGRSGTTQWPVWDTAAHLIVTSPERLVDARQLVDDQMVAIQAACDPSRSDSEVRAVQRADGQPVLVSALLAELVAVSLWAAWLSDGDVDPISGGVRRASDGGGIDGRTAPMPDWRSIRHNGREITVPAGLLLDLTAMARAHAADRCARLIAKRFDVGVLVGIGGDIATAGEAPAGGWGTLVRDHFGGPGVPFYLPSAALATSSAVSRRWCGGGRPPHFTAHCPGTSRPSAPSLRSVSVGAGRCTRARTLSTAALVRGHAAQGWLRDLGVAARFVAEDGEVVTTGRWPADEAA